MSEKQWQKWINATPKMQFTPKSEAVQQPDVYHTCQSVLIAAQCAGVQGKKIRKSISCCYATAELPEGLKWTGC